MEQRVFISYNSDEKVMFCFWKMFFEACGLWVIEKILGRDEDISEQQPHLLILGNEDFQLIENRIRKNRVYLVKNNRNYKEVLKCRPDILDVGKWYKNDKNFRQVLLCLFRDQDAAGVLPELVHFFKHGQIWGAAWLYQELADEGNKHIDAWIMSQCSMTLEGLQKRKNRNWYADFFEIYCEYIMCGAGVKSLFSRSNECERLLEKCKILSQKRGWTSSLYLLSGKICGLSQMEEQYAKYYYLSIGEEQKNTDVWYLLGHEFEKKQDAYKVALTYYKKAYDCDLQSYRALYKLAVFAEEQKEWMDAFQMFQKIKLMLEDLKAVDMIWIRELLYSRKSCKKLIRICQNNVANIHAAEQYEMQLRDFDIKMEKTEIFSKLFYGMFGKSNEEIKKEALKEIREKMKLRCMEE
ncbi:MAG TPA: hypothetical protein DCZ40_10435 [Lachnospiraceae bacterium]|nr:hypothetical protein [Lachnospiraceae bacterium]